MSNTRAIDGHYAKKRFGQNFLQDQTIIHRIVHSIQPKTTDKLVEIGPGLGALTIPVLHSAGHLEVVELDQDVIPVLQKKAAPVGSLTIHQQDALKFDFSQCATAEQPIRVIGNLPYNISTPLLFHLFNYGAQIQDMHFMLQKEVVQRLAAPAGEKAYGRLSVMAQYFCQVEYLFTVPPEAFHPMPKVDSAIVRLTPYKTLPHPVNDFALLENLVAQAFGQRRKTLRNCWKKTVPIDCLQQLDIDPTRRPETLQVAEFVAVANALKT